MNVSVIVPTYNGAHKIGNIVKSLEIQSYKYFEVIVVVDGSKDNTVEVLNSLKTTISAFKIIEQQNKGRAEVRNNGARHAKGDLLIFFDDDMRPLPDCIEKHVAFHKEHPDSIMTGGLREEIKKDTSDFVKFKSFLSLKWNNDLVNKELLALSKEKIFITAANFSIPKGVFEHLCGFDPILNDAEDFDLAVRAYESGVPLYFNPAAFAWHDDVLNCSAYIKRLRQYALAQEKLRALKPELYMKHTKFSIKKINGLKKIVFLLFANRFWIQLVENRNWLQILPSPVRYKVYDFIVTANGVYFPQKVKL